MIKQIFPSLVFSVLILFFWVSTSLAEDRAPSWLVEAARLQVPAYEIKDVPAVVLKSEESVTVSSDGTVTKTVRYAIRFLVREGREEAVARVIYQTDSEKVRDLSAWLIRKSGPEKSYGKKETLDFALERNDLYNEARVRLIDASDDADVGDVFGYETVSEERKVFSQFQFVFQDNLPALSSKFSLSLPTGWRAESVTFNNAKVEPNINGTSYTWELRDLQPIKPEPSSPSWASLSPRIAVSFFPAIATATQFRTFANWNDVARWMAEIEDPKMTVDDALAAKAQDLTVNAKTEFDKIQAISRYVSQIQYISIQVGTGRGGGYIPHSATEVFAKSYGDCKDKANLMRAMLSVLKIQSYMVSITADDPTFVRVEWASPHQFNHCIIAIKIGKDTNAPSVVTHPKLGRLLMFDPTDPYTPLGDLPEDEQGSWALIDHADTDALLQMPVMPAEMNRLDRNIEVTLSPLGGLIGTINEKTIGQTARLERARMRGLSTADYNGLIEGWVSRGVSGAKTTKITPQDNQIDGNFNLNVEFAANSYAQIMQDRLMVFKPAIIGRLERLSFNEGKRTHPYLMDAMSYAESVKIKLPAGFVVDEIPEATQVETSFGKYSATYAVSGENLIFTRSLKLSRSAIPADKYDSIRSFFGQVHSAEKSPVVLMRK